jgi:hypothetical protein
LAVEFVFPTVIFPSLIWNLAMEKLFGAAVLDFSCFGDSFELAPPRLEKFHLPLAALSKVICGSFNTISVTLSCFEKIKGNIFTPTFNDFAVTNGDLLKAGSSAMLMFSTPTVPLRRDRLRFPRVIGRPNAFDASDSILGRKLLTLIKRGSAIKSASKHARTIPAIFRLRFMVPLMLAESSLCTNRLYKSCRLPAAVMRKLFPFPSWSSFAPAALTDGTSGGTEEIFLNFIGVLLPDAEFELAFSGCLLEVCTMSASGTLRCIGS